MDPLSAGLNFGGKIIDVLKGFGIIPDKDQELKIKASIMDEVKQAQDFFLAYFTATMGKDEPWYSPNKLFRPLCSFGAIAFYIYARIYGIELTNDDRILIGGVIGFWFAGRSVEKLFGKA